MKHLLLTTIAAVMLVGCGEPQQSAPSPETKPVELVAQAATPKTATTKAPDISIHDSAKDGNIEAVKQHLAAGADVNAGRSDGGGTPLHFAAGWGHKEIAELLIAKGADVNAKSEGLDMDGWTPLHCAAVFGKNEVVELLIAEGADINAKNRGGVTPLYDAAFKGHKEIAELLIAKGADVNAKNENGYTPLDFAKRHPEIAELLRKHGGKTADELNAAGK